MPNLLPSFLIGFIWISSICLAATPMLLSENAPMRYQYMALILLAPIFMITFLLSAGLLSRPAQKSIIRGRFPRESFHRVYFWRRIYGCCWTTIFYFKPLYFVFLSIPFLKKLLFRTFGYKGPLAFTIYPDTWVRDLPLLHFGVGSYCSNRSTIGSNMCLKDGSILVDRVFVGDRAIIGHLAMVAPGVKLENDVELGVGVALGIRCRMKEGSRIGAGSSINHGTVLGNRSEIGGHSCVGLRVEIGDDIKIPAGANIPAGATIGTQADVNKYLSSENQILKHQVAETGEKLRSALESITLS